MNQLMFVDIISRVLTSSGADQLRCELYCSFGKATLQEYNQARDTKTHGKSSRIIISWVLTSCGARSTSCKSIPNTNQLKLGVLECMDLYGFILLINTKFP